MNCDLFDVGMSAATRNCTPIIPGTGSKAYIFDVDECFPTNIPVPLEGTNEYNWDEIVNGVAGTNDPGINGHLFGIKIKPQTGHPTGTREQGRKVTSSVIEALVDENLDAFAALDSVLPYRNIGLLTSDNAGKFYVYMSPYQQPLYNSSFEGGTDISSDAGTTFTLTYVSGYLATKVVVPNGENLDQYLASKQGGDNTKANAITFTAAPTNGTVAVYVNGVAIKSGDKVLEGADVVVTPTPKSGYRINYLKVGGTTCSTIPYKFKMPAEAVAIQASFEVAD